MEGKWCEFWEGDRSLRVDCEVEGGELGWRGCWRFGSLFGVVWGAISFGQIIPVNGMKTG